MSQTAVFQALNPYNGQKGEAYAGHNPSQVAARLALAQKTFASWKKTSFDQRSTHMRALAEVMHTQRESLAALITFEMGKLYREALAEIDKCADCCRVFAQQAETWLSPQAISTEAHWSGTEYRPLGPVLAIMPWNFPFWQVFRFLAPALMAGNVGLLKHASNVPGCALAIERLVLEAGFPEGCLQTLLIPASQVEALIADPHIVAVTITGSEPAGRSVAQVAGASLKKTVLELGGSDPFWVLDDADIPFVAQKAAQARMINCGQSCIAAKRFLIPRRHYEAFYEAMLTHLNALQPGDPLLPETGYAPLAQARFARELEQQMAQSRALGARLSGPELEPGTDAWLAPRLLDHLSPEMPAWHEELFGPIASLFPYDSEEEALHIINSSRFGLGASVWSADSERAALWARQVESGCVFVNEIMRSDSRIPFGGIKASGYGRELSYLGIREFCNAQTLWIA